MSEILLFAGMALCASACAFCAGVETGFLGVSRMRVMSLARQGSAKAARLERILARVSKAVTVLLVGNNLAAVSFSTLSASLSLALFPGSPAAQTVWAACAAMIMLFGCEYLPKLLFSSRPLRRTLAVAPWYEALEKILAPATLVFEALVKTVFPARESKRRSALSRDSIRTIVADGRNGAALSGFERKLIDRVLTLQTQTAGDLMLPLSKTDSVREDTPLAECAALARRTGHVHLPVFSADGATLAGTIDVRDALRGSGGSARPGATAASSGMSAPFFISAGTRADDILPLMRRRHTPFAAVRAEDGSVAGVITEETVLSALVSGV